MVEKFGTDNESFNNALNSNSKLERTTACNDYLSQQYKRQATLEFTRDRKSMSVVVSSETGSTSLLVKGAPESILDRCSYVATHDSANPIPITPEIREALNAKLVEYGKGLALRCIGLAKIDNVNADQFDLREQSKFINYENDMTFIGVGKKKKKKKKKRKKDDDK